MGRIVDTYWYKFYYSPFVSLQLELITFILLSFPNTFKLLASQNRGYNSFCLDLI